MAQNIHSRVSNALMFFHHVLLTGLPFLQRGTPHMAQCARPPQHVTTRKQAQKRVLETQQSASESQETQQSASESQETDQLCTTGVSCQLLSKKTRSCMCAVYAAGAEDVS